MLKKIISYENSCSSEMEEQKWNDSSERRWAIEKYNNFSSIPKSQWPWFSPPTTKDERVNIKKWNKKEEKQTRIEKR